MSPVAPRGPLYYEPIHRLAALLAARELKAEELVRAVLDRIEAVDGRVKAYLHVTADRALARARAADAARAQGNALGPLAGIPMALKDNLCTAGIPTTCASRILAGFLPPYDATVVRKLEAAGAVLVGKTNMDEFAMGSSTENSAFFPTRNPWALDRVPGGSSGGSAAAVAAGEAVFALGSDTGGSVRQPAALCGVVGMKPTYGRVSRFGLVAFASSLDQIGPLTRDVTDCALVLGAIAGHDPLDSTSVPVDVPDYPAALTGDAKGIRIGVPREYFSEEFGDEVGEAVLRALKVLVRAGADAEMTSLPTTRYALDAYYVIAPAEASSNLARYDGVRYGYRAGAQAAAGGNGAADGEPRDLETMYRRTRGEGFGPEVKRRIMLGTYALSSGYYDAYYLKANKVRTLVRRDFERAFERYDVLLAPTSPTTAFKLGEKLEDPLTMYLTDVCTIPVNLAGLPAVSIPCGLDADGLPIGLQLIGRPFDEATLLRAAYAFEQATDFHTARPRAVEAEAARA